MPGTPYSRGCQICKRRKIKCDESWPTCSPCKRTQHTCPGPSAPFKFVHEGQSANDAGQAGSSRRRGSKKTPLAEASSQLQLLYQQRQESGYHHHASWRPATLINWKALRTLRTHVGTFTVFRTAAPRQAPTSEADSIAARLVLIMEQQAASGSSGVRMQMAYLPFLPARLAQSDCLRHCAALFCAAWEEFLRSDDSRELLNFGLYSNAIQSVQDTLRRERPYSVETLAAMILLERAGTLFGTDQVTNLAAQYRGIEWVLTRKGTLNFVDPFDVTLAFESQHILHTASLMGSSGYLAEASWMNLMERVAAEFLAMDELRCFPEESFILNRSLSRLAAFNADVRTIREDPAQHEELKTSVLHSVSELERPIAKLIDTVINSGLKAGDIVLVPGSPSFVGHSFQFRSPLFATILAGSIMFQVQLLRIIYDLGVLYATPDKAVYANYRKACTRLWMYIPYIAKHDAISAINLLGPILLSLEAATEPEKAALMKQILAIKCYRQRFLGGQKQLGELATSFALHRTGRVNEIQG